MGWVKEQISETSEIFNDITSNVVWRGTPRGNGSPYEYFSDYIKNNYDVTLRQCDEICKMLKKHYGIEKFYAND